MKTLLTVTACALFAASAMAATTTSFRVTATYSDGTDRIFVATGDLDGDGAADSVEIRVTCSGAQATHTVITAREAGSGMATGRRQYQPLVVTKAVGASLIATYDLKQMKTARTAANAPVSATLSGGINPCA